MPALTVLKKNMLIKIFIVLITISYAFNSEATDLISSWRAACSYDANYSAAGNALSAGLEKSKQGDSMILPQVALTANLDQTEQRLHPGDPFTSSTVAQGPQYGSGISLVQPLYDASALANRKELKIQAQEARVQYRFAEQNLILRVAKAYFEVLLAQDKVNLAKAQIDAVGNSLI